MSNPRSAETRDLVNEYGLTINAVSVSILNNSSARRVLLLSNHGATTITISRTSPAVAGTGLTINPSVQPVKLCKSEFAPWLCGELFAISSAAGGLLSIVEIVDQH